MMLPNADAPRSTSVISPSRQAARLPGSVRGMLRVPGTPTGSRPIVDRADHDNVYGPDPRRSDPRES